MYCLFLNNYCDLQRWPVHTQVTNMGAFLIEGWELSGYMYNAESMTDDLTG